ncbi:hypothetical protein GGI42DRAFT_330393 [Trichoderma sp. SZMC 28013]
MPVRFTEDDIESKECLIEHQLSDKKSQSKRWSFLIASIAILAIVGMIELILLAVIFEQSQSTSRPQRLLGELNHLVPEFPIQQVLFRADLSATVQRGDEGSRDKVRENWLSYMPRGNGFIDVNNTEKYILPGPIPYEGKDTYSVAVFHQLHCLYIIMDMYNNLTIPGSAMNTDATYNAGLSISDDANGHVQHCFRYLRQSITCCGDTTLEGKIPNSNIDGTDGTGAVHVCKDYEAIREWAEENRLDDRKHP